MPRPTRTNAEGRATSALFAFYGLVALIVLLAGAAPAFALSLNPSNEYYIKLSGAVSPFRPDGSALGAPVAKASQIAANDVFRGISNLTSLQYHPSAQTVSTAEFDPIVEELTSVFYDLRVSRVTQVSSSATMKIIEVGFVPKHTFAFVDTAVGPSGTAATAAGGFGGHMDFYRESLGNAVDTRYTTSAGSGAFVAGGAAPTAAKPGGGDGYPGLSDPAGDDSLVLEAVFAPLPLGAPCYACLPGVEVLNITFGYRTSNGSIVSAYSRGFGFLNFIGGPLADTIREGGIPADVLAGLAPGMTQAQARAAGYDASLQVGYRPPSPVDPGATGWMASSEDPMHLSMNDPAAVPTPPAFMLLAVTLTLLGFSKREWRTTMWTFGRLAGLAMLAVFVGTPPAAHAFSLSTNTSYEVKLGDATGAFRDATASTRGTAITSVSALAPGDVLRGISLLTSIQYYGTNTPVPGSQFNPNLTEITGLFYDLRLARIDQIVSFGGITTFELGFVPGQLFGFSDTSVPAGATRAQASTGFGGHLDMFREVKGNGVDTLYSSTSGTSGFTAGGGAVTVAKPQGGDSYPGLNQAADVDDSLLLEAVFAPLPTGICFNGCGAGEVLVLTMTVDGAGNLQTGSGLGFLNVIGGSLAPSVLDGGIPEGVLEGYGLTPAEAKAAGLDISLDLIFSAPQDPASTGWLASSDDPMHFTTTSTPMNASSSVPVPASATLVFLGGALAAVRVWRRAA